jgi:hypothetical protein
VLDLTNNNNPQKEKPSFPKKEKWKNGLVSMRYRSIVQVLSNIFKLSKHQIEYSIVLIAE